MTRNSSVDQSKLTKLTTYFPGNYVGSLQLFLKFSPIFQRVALANAKFAGDDEDEEHYVDLGVDEKPVTLVKKEEVISCVDSA